MLFFDVPPMSFARSIEVSVSVSVGEKLVSVALKFSCVLVSTASLFLDSTIVSRPLPPLIESLPSPPVSVSSPAPAMSVSSPAPPSRMAIDTLIAEPRIFACVPDPEDAAIPRSSAACDPFTDIAKRSHEPPAVSVTTIVVPVALSVAVSLTSALWIT